MPVEKKGDALKNILVNVGVLLILVGSMAGKEENLAFFFLGLVLLFIQTFDLKGVELKKLVLAQIILSAALSIAAISQLVTARSFKAPQVFIILLLLGAILIVVETVRKYSEL